MGDNAINAKVQRTTIEPILSVQNGKQAVEFYMQAFGAETIYRLEDESGAVVARLRVGKAIFWVADESPEHANFSPESLGGGSVRMLLIVEEPDSVFERAVAAGADVVWPIGSEHGWRVGRIVDPYGHYWEIGKPLAEEV